MNSRNKNGQTALHMAAWWGHEGVVNQLLLEKKVDATIIDNSGQTAIQIAKNRASQAVTETETLKQQGKHEEAGKRARGFKNIISSISSFLSNAVSSITSAVSSISASLFSKQSVISSDTTASVLLPPTLTGLKV